MTTHRAEQIHSNRGN